MNPRPGWVRNMAIHDMIEKVNFLNDVKGIEKKAAAEMLQNEMRAFVTHEGQPYTYYCPNTGCSYSLM